MNCTQTPYRTDTVQTETVLRHCTVSYNVTARMYGVHTVQYGDTVQTETEQRLRSIFFVPGDEYICVRLNDGVG